MTKLEVLSREFHKALKRLEEVLDQEKNEFIRDAAIQRFEFTFDLSWKALKAHLEETQGILCSSPKSCFREAFRQGVISYDDFWIVMTDLRNETAHTYSEEKAEEIYARLSQVLDKFKELWEILGEKETGGK